VGAVQFAHDSGEVVRTCGWPEESAESAKFDFTAGQVLPIKRTAETSASGLG
jgi:hypothetical protein